MNKIKRFIVSLVLLCGVATGAGAEVTVQCAGISTDAEKTRLILETSASVTHQVFTLDSPDRVVIDIAGARLEGTLPPATNRDRTLVGLRSGVRNVADLRIVLDLKQAVRIKSFVAPTTDTQRQRLMIDLIPKKSSSRSETRQAAVVGQIKPRAALIAIDAGHGGQDPGAIGPTGVQEKTVTLAIARRLARLVNQQKGLRALLIRNTDDFISLQERVIKARQQRADLFISIHADAFDDTNAHGSSVYTLSIGEASSDAAMSLAQRENSVDRGSGVDIAASNDLLATLIAEMTQNTTIEHSSEVANFVVAYLAKVGDLHKTEVQRAEFVVLKALDMPSLLVETAFISNAEEERRLTSANHQYRLAQAMLLGIRAYFRRNPPQGLQAATAD
ncbi:N-acetylmuramoyl-L-alanine amidase [Chromatium okenii]|uniref:N-acetylmuramoyl-L-alanine amidase n=1 Tax=Chromatium okenii TaxID=61644 RepID=UPI00308413AF